MTQFSSIMNLPVFFMAKLEERVGWSEVRKESKRALKRGVMELRQRGFQPGLTRPRASSLSCYSKWHRVEIYIAFPQVFEASC